MTQTASAVYGDTLLDIPEDPGAQAKPATGRVDAVDYLFGTFFSCVALLIAMISNTSVLHWFVLPCWACGVLMSADTFAWLRGRLDTFDPRAMIGLVGVHFFYLSSLIFVAADMQMLYVVNPEDWRPWLGYMGCLNLIGLMLYRFGLWLGQRHPRPPRTIWAPNDYSFPVLVFFIAFAIFMQLLVMVRFGGLSGMLSIKDTDPNSLVGWGMPRLIGASSALLVFLLMIFLNYNKPRRQGGNARALALIIGMFIFQIILSGYSRSRGDMVVPVFWMMILVHYFWRHIKAKFLILLIVLMFPLMVFYTFYKSLGTAAFSMWSTYGSFEAMSAKTDRSNLGVLIGDMARTDVHAYLVYKQVTDPDGYDLRMGRTYYLCWTQVIPRGLWPGRPLVGEKVLAGTDRLYGKGYYRPLTKRRATRAYGLAGEPILNFGVWAAPVPFLIWGFWVGRTRRFLSATSPKDLRLLLTPYLIWMQVNVLFWDMDNHLAHTLLRALVPILAILASVKRVPYVPPEEELLLAGAEQ